ncbi:lamin tail domain-containing protein [Paenibacillus antri]|uniref:lamin tail domain-containing protein n=1 Tax=Paenibacillus antri TaxID=2582848 RepID=UPI001305182E|nr:lamin tail domain-containing protein [Paenibacillus antri]
MYKAIRLRKWISATLAAAVLCGTVAPIRDEVAVAAPVPELFVSEIHPDVSGTDNFEFFEVYNNSDAPIALNDYDFIYRYPNPSSNKTLVFENKTLGARDTIVFWYNNGGNTLDAFNAAYGTSLTADDVVEVTGFDGFSNSAERGVIIRKGGEELSSSSYSAADIGSGLGVHFRLPATGAPTLKQAVRAAPTPGSVDPKQSVAGLPVIAHTPATETRATEGLALAATIAASVTASVYDDAVTAVVYHKPASAAAYSPLPMTPIGGNAYTAFIPSGALVEAQHSYYIEARNGALVETTPVVPVAVQTETFDFGRLPELLITELVPDTDNINGSDGYEFIEIYNNTDETIDLRNYKILYRFTSSTSETEWTWETPLAEIPLPSKQAMVLWVLNEQNQAATVDQFNANFGAALQENANLVRIQGGGGMANGGQRKIVIAAKDGTEWAEASYDNDLETQPNKGIFYGYPIDGTNRMVKTSAGTEAATPGAVSASQVPARTSGAPTPVNRPPVIAHTPVTDGKSDQAIAIAADIENAEQATGNDDVTAKLYFKKASAAEFQSAVMTRGAGDAYAASIPVSALSEASVQYYIEAADSKTTVQTPIYTAFIEPGDFDYARVSPLLVTEIVPDSANVGGADGYEFIEIYNNTDSPINLKDYKILYRYTDSGPEADVVWPTDREDMIIGARDTLVFWIINGSNDNQTVADFNALYRVNLVENENIFRMYSGGMANGGKRGVVVATNTRFELSAAYYDTDEETKPNMGIFYKYPLDGGTTMIKHSAGLLPATPGSVSEEQVPAIPTSLPSDPVPPTFANETGVTEVHQSENLDLAADIRDDRLVRTVALYYKSDRQADYTKRYLQENFNDSLYHYLIYSPELIGRHYIDYYFEYSDGANVRTTDPFRVRILSGRDTSNVRLNVKDGDVLSGTRIIRGTAEQAPASELSLTIDGTDVSAGAYEALESDAYFAFETTGVNFYFKNGVVMGQDILRIFDDTVNSWTTLTVPIDADRLQGGINTVSIRAGSKASPFDDRVEENKDDFDVRNVRLVLADGTELFDARPEFSTRDLAIKMGDSAGKHPVVDFRFDVPARKLASKAYAWDTTAVPDGTHTVAVAHATYGVETSDVVVDNTAPVIEPSVIEGETYRGPFTIAAAVTDALAGVQSIAATLDGKSIALPYATASWELAEGKHTLRVTALDKVGNEALVETAFFVPDETPAPPTLVAPTHGGTVSSTTASLTVKVVDPTEDTMDVSFSRGFKYFAGAREWFAGFLNAVDREPPRDSAPAGEQAFGDEDYAKIAAVDGDYLINDAVDKFPYQRFEVTLDASVKESDPVRVEWKGHSLEGRKVTLYAWDPIGEIWNALDSQVAGTEDFALTAEVEAGDYAVDRRIKLMVQDEIPPTEDDYDYSFVWMSDTQYYSESYPHIYQDIVEWIAEKKDEMKIEYVTHTGDLVDEADKPYQWAVASENMKVLEDANIPYGVLAGNHDVSGKQGAYDNYWTYFGEDRFKGQDTFGGSYNNNRGHYDLVSSHGNDYIFLYMGWGIGDEEIAWMDRVLKQYPDRMAVLNFHEYLLVSGNRAPIADKIHEQVVVPNANVIAVLSGHYHDAELLVDEIDDDGDGAPDRSVYQMLADYQGGPEGGQGYIRLMQFDIDNNKLHIKTYSPYLDDYNFYDPEQYPNKDEFSLDLDLTPKTKRVATDYFAVNVYSDQPIGTVENVQSGANASFDWVGLTAGNYEWYAIAEDEHGAKAFSDIWKFTANPGSSDPDPGTNPDPDPNPGTNPAPSPGTGTTPGAGESTQQVANGGLIIPAQVKEGVASASVGKEAFGEAVEGADTGTVLLRVAESEETVHTVRVSLPAGTVVEALRAGRKTSLAIDAGFAVVTATLDELERFAGATEAEFRVAVVAAEGLSPQAAARIGDNPVYDFEIVVDGEPVSAFETAKGVTVRMNYALKSGQAPNRVVVYYLTDAGELEAVPASLYDEATGAVTFEPKHFSRYAAAHRAVSFDDIGAVPWARADIEALAARDVLNGVRPNVFEPQRPITRVEYLKLLMGAFDFGSIETNRAAAAFSDVARDDWHYDVVTEAYRLGIANGRADGSFGADEPIARQDIAAMTFRAASLAGAALERGAAERFADQADIAAYALEAAASLRSAGIVTGLEDGRFAPAEPATRAQAAAIVHRLLMYYMNQ